MGWDFWVEVFGVAKIKSQIRLRTVGRADKEKDCRAKKKNPVCAEADDGKS